MPRLLISCAVLFLAGCASGKIDVFHLPPPAIKPLAADGSILPIRIATPVGAVTYSKADPVNDGALVKYWAGVDANAFDLIKVQVSETPVECSLNGITSMKFVDQAGTELLTAKQGANGWNTVVITSPSGFGPHVLNPAWGKGWPIAAASTVRAIEFDAKPSCKTDTPARVPCESPACLSLRIEFKKN